MERFFNHELKNDCKEEDIVFHTPHGVVVEKPDEALSSKNLVSCVSEKWVVIKYFEIEPNGSKDIVEITIFDKCEKAQDFMISQARALYNPLTKDDNTCIIYSTPQKTIVKNGYEVTSWQCCLSLEYKEY